MTDFAECSMAMQDFLMILLEICLILELILLLIRITCFYGKKKIITAVTVFAVSFMLMGSLMNDHRYCWEKVPISQCFRVIRSVF